MKFEPFPQNQTCQPLASFFPDVATICSLKPGAAAGAGAACISRDSDCATCAADLFSRMAAISLDIRGFPSVWVGLTHTSSRELDPVAGKYTSVPSLENAAPVLPSSVRIETESTTTAPGPVISSRSRSNGAAISVPVDVTRRHLEEIVVEVETSIETLKGVVADSDLWETHDERLARELSGA